MAVNAGNEAVNGLSGIEGIDIDLKPLWGKSVRTPAQTYPKKA